MKKYGNKKWGRKALVFVLVAGGLVLAGCGLFTKQMTTTTSSLSPLDHYEVDNDIYEAGLQNVVWLTVDPGETVSVDNQIVVIWQGKFHLTPGTTVKFEVDRTDLPQGYSIDPHPLVLKVPDGWGTDVKSFTGTSTITFTAPNTPGKYNYNVKWKATEWSPEGSRYLSGGPDTFVIHLTVKGEETAPTYSIWGAKWDDKNANGLWDENELSIPGWKIILYMLDENGAYTKVGETTTDEYGNYCFDELLPGQYKVEEELQPGWVRTYPSDPYHLITVEDSNVSGINFGNVKTYSISGYKWYDRNKNSAWDNTGPDAEPAIEGWKIELFAADGTTLLGSTSTGKDGSYKFENLKPGTYVVKEGPVSGTWTQTFPLNPNFHTVTIVDDDVTGVNFGNVCEITASGGYTLGFWSNRNGQSVLNKNPGWMGYLNGYYLRNKAGARFTITGYTGFRDWLLKADAVNMSYMLSVQLAATLLNIQYMGTNYTGLGIVIGGTWTSIAEVIDDANTFLATNGVTTAAGPARTQAEFYKNVFDALNNNRLKLIPYDPCPVPAWP